MKGSSFLIRHLCFRPFTRGGDTVYPIGLAISRRNLFVDTAVTTSQQAKSSDMKGCSGIVAPIPSLPYVVKNLYAPHFTIRRNSEREIKALTALEINDIISPGIQHGLFGYKNKDGDVYIVSSHIKGKKPSPKENPLTTENLSSLIDTISVLDRPDKYWSHKAPNRPFHPLGLAMHYDLKADNVLVSAKSAGIIDFEYLDFIKLFPFKKSKQRNNWSIICNYSDICNLPTNLRNFEYRTLLPYLENCDNPQNLFRDFLKIKSNYYSRMAREYTGLKHFIADTPFSFVFHKINGNLKRCDEIIEKERVLANTLKNPDNDVIKSEAIKIQIARFIYLLSTNSHGDKVLINPKQIKSYILNSEKFFAEKAKCCPEQRVYYQCCAKLIEKWKEIIPLMENSKGKNVLDYYGNISNTCGNSAALLKSEYSEKIQPTLDTIVL